VTANVKSLLACACIIVECMSQWDSGTEDGNEVGMGMCFVGSDGVLEDMSLASRVLEDTFSSPWP